jgi:hypothetical protein
MLFLLLLAAQCTTLLSTPALNSTSTCARLDDAQFANLLHLLSSANRQSIDAKRTGGAPSGAHGYSSMAFANVSGNGTFLIPGVRSPWERLNLLFRAGLDLRSATVLDLGSNNGGMLLPLADLVREGVGVDFDAKLVDASNAVAAATCTNLHFARFDLMRQPLDELLLLQAACRASRAKCSHGSNHYDVITMYSVTRWLPNWRDIMTWAIAHSRHLVVEVNFAGSGRSARVADGSSVSNVTSHLRSQCNSLRHVGATHHAGVQDKQMYICETPRARESHSRALSGASPASWPKLRGLVHDEGPAWEQHQARATAQLEAQAEAPPWSEAPARAQAPEEAPVPHQERTGAAPTGEGTLDGRAARVSWALEAPAPAANATYIDSIADLVPDLQTVSERMQQGLATDPSARERLLTIPPTKVALAQCGILLVPFGGRALLAFEAYLNSFVVRSFAADLSRAKLAGGMVHDVRDVNTFEHGAAAARLSPLGDLVVRSTHSISWAKMANAHVFSREGRCRAYLLTLWNAYIEWALGELGIFAKVHAVWCWHAPPTDHPSLPNASQASAPPSNLFLSTLIERWHPLTTYRRGNLFDAGEFNITRPADVKLSTWKQTLMVHKAVVPDDGFLRRCSAEQRASVMAQVVEHLGNYSLGSGLVTTDLKPNDILVRENPRTQRWEARLSDMEAPGTNGHSDGAGIAPLLHPKCALILNLFMATTMFACGPTRRADFAREFVVRSLTAIERAQASVERHCTNGSALRTHTEVTGLYRRALPHFYDARTHFTQMIDAWQRNREVKCNATWDLQGLFDKLSGLGGS